MGRKRRLSESPPLPPFEYMSRNRRAVFGDPPSAYLAAVIERNERASRKREQTRLENEQNQDEEELPRKRPAPDSSQVHPYHTPAADNDYLVWSGSGTPASNTYPVSRTSHSQFADSESNGESPDRSDSTSTDQTNHDGETELSQEEQEDDNSEGSEEDYGNGDEEYQDSGSSDNDADMGDDDNIITCGRDPRSLGATMQEKDEEDLGNRQDWKPGDGTDILLSREIYAPHPIEIDGASTTTTSLLSAASSDALSACNKDIRWHSADQPSFALPSRSSSHMFSVPGTIFVDPIDFEDDDIRSLAHNLAANCASWGVEGNDVLANENIPPAEVIPQDSGHRQIGHRYSPVSQGQGVFHAGSSQAVQFATGSVPILSESPSAVDPNSPSQDDLFREENDNGTVHYPDEFSSELGYQNLDW
ncbi:hypothetical protein BDDG_01959 [Blastomyces dermatitidis ATCC 18188]|uniref:Uncharacterized protein n=1 Tax=Ajellomyces dermatitidis (strain ATCC 18188 / CBS 674.68) TaxID=653446 RepID=F2T708_AJEDA|nr:hypothetical protein BDDG_01959 [Blastomyces dermatitidis ATCC 18188]